ncbi:MAG TPA: CHRD domain-containing protein [Chitinophagaceae bacterium]|jgi:hypothetical protein|nr:CHRD domain-containing protein [Chitinophagaceae bacterium]
MKATFLRFMVASTIALGALFTMPSCDDDDDTFDDDEMFTISGNASGSQVVPSVTGTGTGTITGTYNSNTRVMNYTSTWTGLSGAPTSASLYNGVSGSSGVAVGTPWTLATPVGASGTYTGSMTLTAEQADQLRNGNWYYSYGTTANPGGEIRGQISITD